MARQSNKTDHVLNLLSTGGRKPDNDAPPVDPNRRNRRQRQSQEPAGTDGLDAATAAADQLEAAEFDDAFAAEGAAARRPEDLSGAEGGGATAEQGNASGDPVADSVKHSLEAELDQYLREEEERKEAIAAEEAARAEEEARRIAATLAQGQDSTDARKAKALAEAQAAQEGGPGEGPGMAAARSESAGDFDGDLTDDELAAMIARTLHQGQDSTDARKAKALAELGGDAPAAELMADASAGDATAAPAIEAAAADAQPQVAPEVAGDAAAAPATAAPVSDDFVAESETDFDPFADTGKPYRTVNVMETLVRRNATDYMTRYGYCTCDRCIEDTVALTLSALPAKYVVVKKDAVPALLNFYEGRFNGQMIVELTKACMTVGENPYH